MKNSISAPGTLSALQKKLLKKLLSNIDRKKIKEVEQLFIGYRINSEMLAIAIVHTSNLLDKSKKKLYKKENHLIPIAEIQIILFQQILFRYKKRLLIQSGPAKTLDFNTEEHDVPDAIASQLYSEDPNTKAIVDKQLRAVYAHPENHLIHTLLKIVALGALGKQDGGDLNKTFKAIINNSESVKDLKDCDSQGLYTCKNSIFIAGQDSTFLTFLHEATHYIAEQIYKNNANPYGNQTKNKDEFDKSILTAKEKLENLRNNSKQAFIKLIIETLLDTYSEGYIKNNAEHQEFIARIPQVIGLFCRQYGITNGIPKAYQWLNIYIAPVLDYLKKYFIPDCEKYIASHNVKTANNPHRLFIPPTDLNGQTKEALNPLLLNLKFL